ncbi:MAG: alpha/beta fold hydrolase [Dehalococcoidia bacterium]
MPTAKVGDVNLEYYVEGEGPPLLMIMGLGGQARSWGEPALDEMRKRFQVIRFSNRGTGASDKPEAPVTIRMMADDAAGLLRELDIPKAHVLGISMGGMISQELVLNHPQMVQGLVLGCTFCGPAHSVPAPPEAVARFGRVMTLPLQERIQEFWRLTVSPEFLGRGQAFLDEIIRIHLDTPTPWETFGKQFVAVQGFDTFDRLPQIKSPTLLIHGDKDLVIAHGNMELLAGRIQGAKTHTVRGAGHMFFWEQPSEVAGVVSEFLAKVPAAA